MVTFVQLPPEILVRVLKSTQNRFCYYNDHPSASLSYNHGTSLEIVDPKWRHIMLTCVTIRSTALQSPELWSAFDTSWPRSWVELCIQRSEGYPLQLKAVVRNKNSLELAEHLLSKADHVAITFDEDWSMKEDSFLRCQKLFRDATRLRSLTVVDTIGDIWGDIDLTANVLPSSITYLSIERFPLVDLPPMPHLVHLRLAGLIVYPDSKQIQRWFLATPHVTSLELHDFVPTVALGEWSPVQLLPHLAHLSLEGKLEDIRPLISILPVPRRSLTINARCSNYVQRAGIEDIHALVSAFWRVTGVEGQALPSGTLYINSRHAMNDSAGGEFSLHGCDTVASRKLDVKCRVSAPCPVAILGPFLRTVTRCTIDAYYLHQIVWDELGALWALQTLRFAVSKVRYEDSPSLQVWADERARAGMGPVQVRVEVPGWAHIREERLWWLCVEWNTVDGPLAEAGWMNPSSAFFKDGIQVDGYRVFARADRR